MLVLNFDEWGGYYDHVVPPQVQDDTVGAPPGPHPDYRQLGFRVPCVGDLAVVTDAASSPMVRTSTARSCA